MHVAPYYEQIISLAATTAVPHLAHAKHQTVAEAQRLRALPGTLYLMKGGAQTPPGFTAHDVADSVALQYYGGLSGTVAPVAHVRLMVSDDLRLLCLAVTCAGAYRSVAPRSTLQQVGAAAERGDTTFTLYHYFRPNRPATELTRPLDKYYVHRPRANVLDAFASGSGWVPQLAVPTREKARAQLTPLPPYRPPQSYLMGLAERLAVIPGNSFGRRSNMWGHWF
ncbi:hypothetical protein STCU_09425 [Strigomonas culicis]|nr:hypothetical protein STCU_09425 [Strigomonas culicis]|eukprot:EPY19495.1 hypothetical protein STCU_09425 [Strigomonas culicis]